MSREGCAAACVGSGGAGGGGQLLLPAAVQGGLRSRGGLHVVAGMPGHPGWCDSWWCTQLQPGLLTDLTPILSPLPLAPHPSPQPRLQNWPSCCPFIYHNIREQIPAWNRSMVRFAYLVELVSIAGVWSHFGLYTCEHVTGCV